MFLEFPKLLVALVRSSLYHHHLKNCNPYHTYASVWTCLVIDAAAPSQLGASSWPLAALLRDPGSFVQSQSSRGSFFNSVFPHASAQHQPPGPNLDRTNKLLFSFLPVPTGIVLSWQIRRWYATDCAVGTVNNTSGYTYTSTYIHYLPPIATPSSIF